MRFYATTIVGFEDLAADEIRELTSAKIFGFGRGRVYFEADVDAIFTLNRWSRSLHRIMILLGRCSVESLDDIYGEALSVDYGPYIRRDQTFAVRSERVGKHDFTSVDVSRVVGQAVIDSYLRDYHHRLRVNLDFPDVIVRVVLVDSELSFGIDTTGDESLHRRGYRVFRHPAPIKPSLAHLLLRFSGWKPNFNLLDPMCGGGSILIEAAQWALSLPPRRFREKYLYLNLNLKPTETVVVPSGEVELNLTGIDKIIRNVIGSRRNAVRAGVADYIKFKFGDATKLREFLDEEVEYIVTNPPYGVRVSKPEHLYEEFVRALQNVGFKYLTVITGRYESFKRNALKIGFRLMEERIIVYGKILTGVQRYMFD